MKPCWKDRGLTEDGAERADLALLWMTMAVNACGSEDIARSVLAEAMFRKFYLPERSKAYQRRYLAANGDAPKKRGRKEPR